MKQYIQIVSFIVIAILVTSCGNSNKNNTLGAGASEVSEDRIVITKVQFEQSDMKLGGLEEMSFPEIVKATGLIDVPPQNRAIVSAIAGGVIKNTPLLIGDKVNKGQALLTIQNPEFITMQQDYIEVKEQLTYLKSEYERQQMLVREKITSQKKFLKAESDYKTAQARYTGLRKQLILLNISPTNAENGTITSVATIYAPIRGSITKLNINKGMRVTPTTELLEIIDNEHIHLELSVFEKDILKIQKDQVIEFTIPETSDKVYNAKVHLIGTAIDESRTIVVHGHLDKESKHNFLTGMFINANIITKSSLVKVLPETAVVEVEERYYAMRLDSIIDSTYYFEKVEVIKGDSYKDFTIVQNSIVFKETDQFLTKGAFSMIAE